MLITRRLFLLSGIGAGLSACVQGETEGITADPTGSARQTRFVAARTDTMPRRRGQCRLFRSHPGCPGLGFLHDKAAR